MPNYQILLEPSPDAGALGRRTVMLWYPIEAENEAEAADRAMEETGMNAVTWREAER